MQGSKVNVLKKILGIILVAPVILSLSLFAADPVPQNLWNLDETTGSTYADSYGMDDGNCTLPDGCPMPIDGQVYGAQSFDGLHNVIDVNGTVFDRAADANVTIEFWMKSNIDPLANKMMIGRQGDLGTFDLSYVAVAPGGLVRAAVGSSSGLEIHWTGVTGTSVIADGQWNHIAYVVTSDMMKVYVNGVLDINVTRNGPGQSHIDTGKVTFGSLDRVGSWEYNGELDEITIYDVELNASTIQQHFANGSKPHLVEVTPVPTPTTDTTPDYTFSTDKNGTINYGGSCTSATTAATAGDNTITFDTLAIGVYNDCTITVTAADGNVSDPLAVSPFEVTAEPDVTAPTLAEVTAVVSPTDDNTPDYTFSSTEAGTITYGGSCTSATTAATAGDNTITFDTLADGVYGDCTITVTDAASNASTPLLVSEFVVDTTVPDTTVPDTPVISSGGGGGCTYNPDSKNFDMMFLLMIALGLFYPFRRRFIK